uniref:Uncharacterized protein n=1 Tax=Streptomyces sp. NBC_00180 TaxID=2903632 RepID=A0AAU1I9G6_9ACTN
MTDTDLVKKYAMWLIDYVTKGEWCAELYDDIYATLRDVIFPPQAFLGMATDWTQSQDPDVVNLFRMLESAKVYPQELEAAIIPLYFAPEDDGEGYDDGPQDEAVLGQQAPALPTLDEYPTLKALTEMCNGNEAGAEQFLAQMDIDDALVARFAEFEQLVDERD